MNRKLLLLSSAVLFSGTALAQTGGSGTQNQGSAQPQNQTGGEPAAAPTPGTPAPTAPAGTATSPATGAGVPPPGTTGAPVGPLPSATAPSPATPGTATAPRFGTLDRNADGSLSRDELVSEPPLSASFERLDTDRSGTLSDGEFSAFEPAAPAGSGPSTDPRPVPKPDPRGPTQTR